MKKLNLHKLSLSIALVGAVAFGSSAWACEKPQVSGYDFVDCLNEGLATVKQNGKYGLIDKTGKMVIPAQYDYITDFRNGIATVMEAPNEAYWECREELQDAGVDVSGFCVEHYGKPYKINYKIDKTGKRVD